MWLVAIVLDKAELDHKNIQGILVPSHAIEVAWLKLSFVLENCELNFYFPWFVSQTSMDLCIQNKILLCHLRHSDYPKINSFASDF